MISRRRQTWFPSVITSTPEASSASAILGVIPSPSAAFSPFATTEVQPELLAQARDELLDRAAAGTPVHVCDEEDLQGVASVAAGWISNETWLPASCV